MKILENLVSLGFFLLEKLYYISNINKVSVVHMRPSGVSINSINMII